MSWTYDETALDLLRNQVRLKLGDTKASDPQLNDEEIDLLLEQNDDSVVGAALVGSRLLAARYARDVDKWVGDLKILASQRHKHYLDLAETLATASVLLHGVPSAGGVYVADKESNAANESLVSPSFIRGMHDNVE